MTINRLTNYDQQANNFVKLEDYSLSCGTDYLAVKDAPHILQQLKPLHRILDLGCGSGLATRYLKMHFPNTLIIGADINKSMLEKAISADPEGTYVHLSHNGEQITYPFTADFFDAVVCSFVVHENRSVIEIEQFFSNVVNILRPGGIFLAWDVYKNIFQGRWLTIETISPMNNLIKNGQQYIVKILPANAEVKGTYWDPELLAEVGCQYGLNRTHIDYPLVEQNQEINWLDETRLAPYFVLQMTKGPVK